MFEALLEKILKSKLGHFLNGLDEKNLTVGVWSGNVEIENVSVKPSIFELFHLPLTMIHSHIGRISLKIPWKNLSSSPVIVVIEKVLAVVSPKKPEDWTFNDYNKFNKRLELLDEYYTELFAKLMKREQALVDPNSSDKKESSYMDKVALKVLDNLQITIKSIHIRVENPWKESRFSFGITLDFLTIHATNAKWEKTFIDRTNQENAKLPNYKILLLENFAIYWNSDEKSYFCEKKNEKEVSEGLLNLIKIQGKEIKDMNYLINIKAELKSIQDSSKTKTGPEFWFALKMDNIDCCLRKTQLRDVIQLTSYFNKFKIAFEQNRFYFFFLITILLFFF